MKSRAILCIVPDARKAAAVLACLEGEVSPMAPASILQTHPATTVYLDRASAATLKPAARGDELGGDPSSGIEFPGLSDLQVNGFGGVDLQLAEADRRSRQPGARTDAGVA